MSLMDLIMSGPSAADKALSVISSMQGGASDPQASHGRTRPTAGGNYNGMQGAHNEAIDIARWIENRPGNFTVGALNGWHGQGPISSGHVENSQHYGKGYAGDVNYYGGGRFGGNEDKALSWLYNRMDQRYGNDLTELLWHVPDHYDHLHYGTRPGG